MVLKIQYFDYKIKGKQSVVLALVINRTNMKQKGFNAEKEPV